MNNDLIVIEKENLPEVFNPGGTEPLLDALVAGAIRHVNVMF